MTSTSELVWIPALDDYWWTTWITGINFGSGTTLADSYTLQRQKIFFDTGTSFSYVPPQYYSWLIAKINA